MSADPDPAGGQAEALGAALARSMAAMLSDNELAMLIERLGRPPKRSHHRKRDDGDAGPRPSDPHDAGPRPAGKIIQGKVEQ